jgi:hypothetical protein
MSVFDVQASGLPTSDIAVRAGRIVYVEGMVAESVAFRAGRTVGPVERDSVLPGRWLTAFDGSPCFDGSRDGQADRLLIATGAT